MFAGIIKLSKVFMYKYAPMYWADWNIDNEDPKNCYNPLYLLTPNTLHMISLIDIKIDNEYK